MDVGLALRNTSKGRLKYDKYWVQEGRAKEVLDGISEYSTKPKLAISPKILSILLTDDKQNQTKNDERDSNAADPSTPSVTVKKIVQKSDITEVHYYEHQTEMELPILEYEKERLKSVQEKFTSKRLEFEQKSSEIEQQLKQEYLLVKKQHELDAKRRAVEVQKLQEAMLNEVKEKQMLKQEQYQSHVKTLSEKVFEAEQRQKKIEEEQRKKEQDQAELKIQLHNFHNEAQSFISKSMEKLSSCEYTNFLRVPIEDRLKCMAEIMHPVNSMVDQAKMTELSIDDILRSSYPVKAAHDLFQDILNDIESAKIKASSNQTLLPPIESNSSHDAVDNNVLQITQNEPKSQTSVEMVVATKPKDDKKKLLAQFIAPDAVENYHKIMENFKRVEDLAQSLKNDPRNKKFRFDIQKAINTPINSLSSNSGSQIKAKIARLLAILSGQIPELRGRDMSSSSVVYNFCSNLIAKQFVEQGYSQIAAQHSTAFPIALAVLEVWNKKPDVGSLILSHFYTRCPYLVPYYPPRKEGQSDRDYYVSLGYELTDDNTPEDKHKFLNRISGFVRLYAAIIISPLPPPASPQSHPHGLDTAWKWLARTLNMDPRPDVTPTVLYDFLDVAGHSLQKAYGRQFRKLLHILCKDYFPRIRQATPGGTGGPVERLETFLQQAVKRGHVSPPEGVLEASFWNR